MEIKNFMTDRKRGGKLLGRADYLIFLIAFMALIITIICAATSENKAKSAGNQEGSGEVMQAAYTPHSVLNKSSKKQEATADTGGVVASLDEALEEPSVPYSELEVQEASSLSETEKDDDESEVIAAVPLEPRPIYEKYGLTEYEFNVLCKTIWHEYGYGCLEGQAGVASVILNRVNSEYFPNDIVSVILAPNQFAEKYAQAPFIEPTETMLEAIDLAFSGVDYSNGAVYFANPDLITNKKTLAWFNSLEVCNQYEGVVFYK